MQAFDTCPCSSHHVVKTVVLACRYRRCSDADHIRRDVDIFSEQAKKVAEEKKIIDQIISFKEQVRCRCDLSGRLALFGMG